MKRLFAVIFVITLFFSGVWGAKTVIAVQDFSTNKVEKNAGVVCAEEFRNVLVQNEKLKILDRSVMEVILREQNLQMSGCTSAECAVKLGRILAAKIMIIGSVTKLGKTYYINIKGVDVETSAILFSKSDSSAREIDQLISISHQLASEISMEQFIGEGKTGKKDTESKKKVREKKKKPLDKPSDKADRIKHFGVSLGYPYLGIQYRLNRKLKFEGKYETSEGVSFISLRTYYNYFSFWELDLYAGIDLGYTFFDYEGLEGNGLAYAGFAGVEYLPLDFLGISLDIGGYYNSLTFTQLFEDKTSGELQPVIYSAVNYYF